MYLLHMVVQVADLFFRVPQIRQYKELREEIQSACPEVWSLVERLELEHWRNFWGFPYALEVLRENIESSAVLPGNISRNIQSLVGYQATSNLESLSKSLGKFADGLLLYFFKPETYLEATPIYLQPVLRRSLLDIKGCFMDSQELRRIKSVLDKAVVDNKKAELFEKAKLYEQELKRRKITLPISPEAYDVALEIAGPSKSNKRMLLAIKQADDMGKTVKELLFQLLAYNQKYSFYVDGESINLKFEEKPFGRLVQCHMSNILPLMIPGQILHFEQPSGVLPTYVVALSVVCQITSETKVLMIDVTGIDLEVAGPKLLSRIAKT